MYLTDVQWLEKKKPRQRPPHLPPNQRAGDGTKWMNATGWSCYTCKGQTESDRLADCLYKAAEQILKIQVIRTDYARDGDPDWEENFYILRIPCALQSW